MSNQGINEFVETKKNEEKTSKKIDQSFIMDIPVEISFEIGKITMLFKDVIALETGSVININKSPQEPLTIYANGKEVGKGEIVMLDDSVGIRILSWKEEK